MYFPLGLINYTVRYAAWQPCTKCGEKRAITYLTDGVCVTCLAKADALYNRLDWLAEHRRQFGRGRNEGAAYVRDFCKTQRKEAKAELKRLGFPATRPGDERTYGPGNANWQRAGGR